MSQKAAPRINKLPFLLTDLACLGVAIAILYRTSGPIGGGQLLAIVACVALGAWACVTPFLRDHDMDVRLTESGNLADTVQQIAQLKMVAAQVQGATAQWQTFQENAGQSSAAMKKMAEQLTHDALNFAESLKQSSDAEKGALRLEVEKRKRAEGEWLKIMVALLDHVHALYQAGVRSGQQNVIQQLGGFQAACRDVVRRVGLVPIEAQPGEAFNPGAHRLADEKQTAPEGAVIAGTLATGFSFQGQLVRPVLVALAGASNAANSTEAGAEAAGDDESGQVEPTDDDPQREVHRPVV